MGRGYSIMLILFHPFLGRGRRCAYRLCYTLIHIYIHIYIKTKLIMCKIWENRSFSVSYHVLVTFSCCKFHLQNFKDFCELLASYINLSDSTTSWLDNELPNIEFVEVYEEMFFFFFLVFLKQLQVFWNSPCPEWKQFLIEQLLWCDTCRLALYFRMEVVWCRLYLSSQVTHTHTHTKQKSFASKQTF
jgi:hypothetical protein